MCVWCTKHQKARLIMRCKKAGGFNDWKYSPLPPSAVVTGAEVSWGRVVRGSAVETWCELSPVLQQCVNPYQAFWCMLWLERQWKGRSLVTKTLIDHYVHYDHLFRKSLIQLISNRSCHVQLLTVLDNHSAPYDNFIQTIEIYPEMDQDVAGFHQKQNRSRACFSLML